MQFVLNFREELARLFPAGPGIQSGRYRHYYSFRFNQSLHPSPSPWKGFRQPGETRRPHLVFQMTTRGECVFEKNGCSHRIPPGSAFCAYLPSNCRFRRPPDVPEWEFFWLDIEDLPRIPRLRDLLKLHSGVLSLEACEGLVRRTLDLMALSLQESVADELAEEWQATMWAFDLERTLRQSLYPRKEQEKLRAHVADVARSNPSGTSVETLARDFGMSRSHFTRHFKRTTGESPAACLMKARLQLVAEKLHNFTDKLEVIAREAGFRDASELCRAFRRQYGLSPAAFRRQFLA